ncbi:hypothetical protein NUW58_g5885 [Xylaria curta]|uniref:Uncharacterized protein n=1 Tax=Xylaria curta TaxID=42375 RepID=A0ACC1P0Q1_9PEZI|nr:hypothetical protein NUW58_g5885 [Xylaria curta]
MYAPGYGLGASPRWPLSDSRTLGAIDLINPPPADASRHRRTFLVSANNLNHAAHGYNIYEIADHDVFRAAFRWDYRLDGITKESSAGLPLAHWGSSELTGRGLAALSAPGHIYQLTLGDGEEFVAHPANVVAYTITKQPPLPFRFKSSSIRFQIPSVTTWLETTKFFQNMRQTEAYKFLTRVFYSLRTTARRTIWGDRLFLQFRGPMTILMSSRGSRISDVLTNADVNEIADAPAGAVPAAVELATKPKATEQSVKLQDGGAVKLNIASVGQDGKVRFESVKDLKEFEK